MVMLKQNSLPLSMYFGNESVSCPFYFYFRFSYVEQSMYLLLVCPPSKVIGRIL